MHSGLFEQFVLLWVVIDPIGTIPVFVAATAGLTISSQKRIARQAAIFAAAVLLFFLVLGQFLIDALGITLPSFQIAGGIVLFLFALTMIFGTAQAPNNPDSLKREKGDRSDKHDSPAVFPLAVPSLASPGAMLAIVLLTDNNRFSIPEQAVTAAMMLVVLAVAYFLMRMAAPILKIIKPSGAAIVSRVMGMILAAVAVDNIIDAIAGLMGTMG
ncbi:MarC family protein [Pseudooceanicola nanhaiensis]|uniref:MarC family protein n=1 Tax=Pseudooceanicola nanhaiensis TaxID=375761 RepID=UPI001CD6BD05|nr:MarC family protein [Pseudooceanicola nanhaiensis]MCA0922395.1 MarC family protein [Pseudooceanicola nanhaiensis]